MKRASRRKTNPKAKKTEPTPDQIRRYMQCVMDEHQVAWHTELLSAEPHWVYLIGLHLRMVELDRMEEAVEEFL